ncbi:MAG: adenylate/guanylate cyclase domain-containing protein [Snowella sp.]|nr:adenylate/guanylate cyclase domain-containing protein [Snowella sp.]
MEEVRNNPYFLIHTLQGNQEFPLGDKNYWTIGRNKENDIVIRDHSISRNHAILQRTETGDFLLIDLGSSNGTFINGRRVSIPATIKSADRIMFGKSQVEFYSESPEAAKRTQTLSERDTETNVVHERRLMSVMVADMRNFTVLSRQLNEEILSILISSWFRHTGEIIRHSGSWVDKYIGDAIMAVWFHSGEDGTPEEVLQIFEAVRKINDMTEKLSSQYPVPFPLKIGVGINTGYAMVGNTGSEEHPDYTAIGDTVNAAFRLESATKILGIDVAIGEQTCHYLSKFQQFDQEFEQHQVNLKGYETPISTGGTTFKRLTEFLQANQTLPTLS